MSVNVDKKLNKSCGKVDQPLSFLLLKENVSPLKGILVRNEKRKSGQKIEAKLGRRGGAGWEWC